MRCRTTSSLSLTSNGSRVTVSGATEKMWEVGGKYRALGKLQLEQDVTAFSKPIGSLKAGKLVLVEEVVQENITSMRLRVKAETGRLAGRSGWVSGLDSQAEFTLDLRNHLEFENLMRSCHSPSQSSSSSPTRDPVSEEPTRDPVPE
ncbi:unnamed protein product, partial [Polarella glacialis]